MSIVCVANDDAVRSRCLDASIAAGLADAPATEYLPIDNSGGAFASAGAALNHGARLARNDYVAFVHQDVWLHSLSALEEAAGMLADHLEIGLHGAVGIAPDGRVVGRVRDRVVLIGDRVAEPADVDSLDEVLFMVPRATVLDEPLAEDPELAWHAYAVEYGLRMRALGRRVTAGGIPLTHNSLTVNLDRLDVAHRAVAARHPSALPLRTTCGVVESAATPRAKRLAGHRWRYRWLRESAAAHRIRRALGGGQVVLSDLRHDLDDALAGFDGRLDVLNLDCEARPAGPPGRPLELVRRDRTVTVATLAPAALEDVLAGWRPGRSLVVTNLAVSHFRWIAPALPPRTPLLAGYHDQTGCWLLLGELTLTAPAPWTSRRATPFAMTRLGGRPSR